MVVSGDLEARSGWSQGRQFTHQGGQRLSNRRLMVRLRPRARLLEWQAAALGPPDCAPERGLRSKVEKDPVDVSLGPLLAMEAAQHAPGGILLGAIGHIVSLPGQQL